MLCHHIRLRYVRRRVSCDMWSHFIMPLLPAILWRSIMTQVCRSSWWSILEHHNLTGDESSIQLISISIQLNFQFNSVQFKNMHAYSCDANRCASMWSPNVCVTQVYLESVLEHHNPSYSGIWRSACLWSYWSWLHSHLHAVWHHLECLHPW